MAIYRVRELRLARGWSQEQLAEMASLSVRTIQRIENGEQASLETLSAIAAVMELKVNELYLVNEQGETAGENKEATDPIDQRVENARLAVEKEMNFFRRLFRSLILCLFLFVINWFTSPQYYWIGWVVLGFGISLSIQAINIFVLGNWMDRWQQKRLQNKLRKP
ncbi:DNA-binding protein [Yersinia entomophaga]|uniref:DNA-binding protein n=1 Tax=Yersinia entomophaga TaxID=935293 RepID=A0ABN4Q2Q2_YERET|nr:MULTISPECIES: helix-turn-helix domain-containing protein [Yersinia]ANI31677.1 DNA-binding protein [Yersinia entomophaga]OWF87134.1 DNA-binding protein [Yersinia entomophaga]